MSLVGRNIGRYRILEQLGQGGMSVVYKGLDTALDREVAVKVLHPHLSGKEESRRRLAREAKAVAKLRHPNILEVFDFAGAEAEDAYIVTEYIRGQTLRQYLNAHGFDPPEIAAMVVHEIAAALAHAHEAGVIHRDLKPENVMVREDGVLKLMDFGIAKIIDRDDKMTITGALVGSPAHMAPEIIEGEEAGPEADVFSLGTMLYLFATTRLPFTAPNTTATLKKILDGVYDDPRQLIPTLSDDLAEIIATCLLRQPTQRYSSAGKLKEALGGYLESVGLSRVGEELASFFADPPSYRKALLPRLAGALVARGERFIAEKRPAKALSALNQVLALDAGNIRALQLLQEMNVSRKRQRAKATRIRAAIGLLVAAAVAGGGYAAWDYGTRADDFRPPLVAKGTDVLIPAAVFPSPQEPPEPPQKIVELAHDTTADRPPVRPVRTDSNPVKVARAELPVSPEVEVAVVIRPYGYLQVDDGKRSDEALSLFKLRLKPGKHRFRVSCDGLCVDDAEAVEETIPAQGPHQITIAAPLKPARLMFFDFPPEASITVAGQPRGTVRQSQEEGIKLTAPREGLMPAIYRAPFEVSLAGFQPFRGTTQVEPGKLQKIYGRLSPQ